MPRERSQGKVPKVLGHVEPDVTSDLIRVHAAEQTARKSSRHSAGSHHKREIFGTQANGRAMQVRTPEVLFERALVFKFVTTCLTNPVVLLVCLIHMSIPFLRTAVPGEGRIALIMKADVRRQISQNMQPVRN
jgi:hypothetical protein